MNSSRLACFLLMLNVATTDLRNYGAHKKCSSKQNDHHTTIVANVDKIRVHDMCEQRAKEVWQAIVVANNQKKMPKKLWHDMCEHEPKHAVKLLAMRGKHHQVVKL